MLVWFCQSVVWQALSSTKQCSSDCPSKRFFFFFVATRESFDQGNNFNFWKIVSPEFPKFSEVPKIWLKFCDFWNARLLRRNGDLWRKSIRYRNLNLESIFQTSSKFGISGSGITIHYSTRADFLWLSSFLVWKRVQHVWPQKNSPFSQEK